MSEILGTLFKYLLALLAITAVVAILYEALSSNKVSTAVSEITTLQANINQLYAGTGISSSSGNAGDLTTDIINAKAAPAPMINGTTLTGPWGGTVTVKVDTTTANAGDVDLAIPNIPQDACVKIATALLPSMTQITFSAGSAATVKTSDTSPTTEIAANCAAGTTISTLTFTFPVS